MADQISPEKGQALFNSARSYCQIGARVFPLHPREKKPAIAHGVNDASEDPDLFARQFLSGCNIGVATGFAFDAIDLDGEAAIRGFASMLAPGEGFELATIEDCERLIEDRIGPVVITGRGAQVYCVADPERTNQAKLLDFDGDAIDYRARGGYVVGIESIHPNGACYHLFSRWFAPKNKAPEWLPKRRGDQAGVQNDLLSAPKFGDAANDDRDPTEQHQLDFSSAVSLEHEGQISAYQRTVLSSNLAHLRSSKRGSRNDSLNKSAFNIGQVIGENSSFETLARSELSEAAREIGLAENEITATIESGILKGKSNPKKIDAPQKNERDSNRKGGRLPSRTRIEIDGKECGAFDAKDHPGVASFAIENGLIDGLFTVATLPKKIFKLGSKGIFEDCAPEFLREVWMFIGDRCVTTDQDPRPFPSDQNTAHSIAKRLSSCEIANAGRALPNADRIVFEDGGARQLSPSEFVIPGGVYNAETMDFTDRFFATWLDLACVPIQGKTPEFDNFCASVGFAGDRKIRLLEALALPLFGRLEGMPQMLPHFCGPAGCGKSTIAKRLLQHLAGSELGRCNIYSAADIAQSSFVKSALKTGSIGVIDDCSDLRALEDEILNNGCGERSIQMLNFKNQDPRQVSVSVRLVLISNEVQLGLIDKGGRFRRRLLNVVFADRDREIDPKLFEKLLPESAAILFQILSAALAMAKRGKPFELHEDEELRRAIASYGNPVMEFVLTRLEPRNDGQTLSADRLYGEFKTFCDDANLKPISKIEFARKLKTSIASAPGFGEKLISVQHQAKVYSVSVLAREDRGVLDFSGACF